jgi:beta-galactosidase GanA
MSSILLDSFSKDGTIVWEGNVERSKGGFPDGRASAAVKGKITACKLPGNWESYGSLQFTIYSPLERTVVGGINIYDQTALDSPDLEYGDFVEHNRSLMIGEGITHIVIRIDPISTQRGNRMLDVKNIRKIEMFIPEPLQDETPISFADLRLCREHDAVDVLGSARPGDSIIYIKHLDISCYTWQPENYTEPEDVAGLAGMLEDEMNELKKAIRAAEINGKQTYYSNAVMIAAEVASISRPMLAWHFSPRAKRRNLSEALFLVREEKKKLLDLLSSRRHEDDEDDSNLLLSLVKPIPDLGRLKISENKFVDASGKPVLVCAMSYHNEGALLEFFAPERHKMEIYAVGGGSRYDIEWSPVYEAFHIYPGTERVGWKGWCGHLIKDQWAMGGRKENVVLCLENERILEAIEEYNRIHAADWIRLPNLMYIILGYELSYLCYCDESLRRFRLWLKERHGNIETLNQSWGTYYESFDIVTPPATTGHGPVPDANRAAWFDWADWNMRRFTNHLKWSYNTIRKLHPDIPICAGGTSSMFSANIGTTGIDEEMIINEVDDVILHEGKDILGIDLFHALARNPKPLVDPEQGGNCDRWFLNYLHCKSAISMFWWPKQPSRQFPRSTLVSPVHGTMPIHQVLEHLTTALDVRRLNEEIASFWDIPKEAAILYSRTNMIQVDPTVMTGNRTPYLSALRDCYEAARCLDTGITFVSEKQLLEGKGADFKMLILPAVKHLPEAVFKELDRYVSQGGTIIATPESLMSDEYNRARDYLKAWGIKIKSTQALTIKGFGEVTQRYDQNLERTIHYGSGKEINAVKFTEAIKAFDLKTSGLFQDVEATGGEIAATGPDGEPVLLHIPRGKGHIWYLAGMPERLSMTLLLDQLFEKSGIRRSVKVTDSEGRRVPGLEARLVRRKIEDLVYLANESGKSIEFTIETDRHYSALRELRSLQYFDEAGGTIENGQVLLFSFQEDPKGCMESV